MRRNRWKEGPAPAEGTVLVSATRFLYARWRHMPAVWWHGWRLRGAWGSRQGAVGLFTAVELGRPVTYSMSVWSGREELGHFMSAPEHLALIRAFRGRLSESTGVSWESDDFEPERAWREAMERLEARVAEAKRQEPPRRSAGRR